MIFVTTLYDTIRTAIALRPLILRGAILVVALNTSAEAACTPNKLNSSPTSSTQLQATANNDCVANTGTITISSDAILVGAFSGVNVSNSGALISLASFGLLNLGFILEFQNTGTASATSSSNQVGGLKNSGTINLLNNTSSISGVSISENAYGIANWSSIIGTIINTGFITGTSTYRDVAGIDNPYGSIGYLKNDGTISGTTTSSPYGSWGISNSFASIGTLENNGTISGTSSSSIGIGILNGLWGSYGGNITSIINTGHIYGASVDSYGYGINNETGTITTLNNIGSILGTSYGINNTNGVIQSFTNYQGGNSSTASTTALTYIGNLPSTYNTFITSKTHYGQLVLTNPVDTMTFDVAAGSNLQKATYTNVLTGITSSSITGFSGRLNGISWKLVEYDTANHYWNLVAGPSSDNTLIALRINSTLVRNVLNSLHSELINTSGYDCKTFDKNRTCISFQARYSSWDNLNDGAGVLIGSYRLTDNMRIGAFADYRLLSSRLTNIKFSDDVPTFGGFVGYSKNADETGLNGKVSAAFNMGNISVTRDSSLANTESGNGKTKLTSHQTSGEVSWGLRLSDSSIALPFVGIRQSSASRHGYKETTVIDTVELPITYNDYTQRSVTGISGIRFKGGIFDRTGYQLALGVEHDINRKFTAFSGTSDIDGLITFSLSNSGPSKKTRGFGSTGIHYQIERNQRLTNNISLREQPHSSQLAVSVMSGYQMSF